MLAKLWPTNISQKQLGSTYVLPRPPNATSSMQWIVNRYSTLWILHYGVGEGTDSRIRNTPSMVISEYDSAASQLIDIGIPRSDLVFSLALSLTVADLRVLPVVLSFKVTV